MAKAKKNKGSGGRDLRSCILRRRARRLTEDFSRRSRDVRGLSLFRPRSRGVRASHGTQLVPSGRVLALDTAEGNHQQLHARSGHRVERHIVSASRSSRQKRLVPLIQSRDRNRCQQRGSRCAQAPRLYHRAPWRNPNRAARKHQRCPPGAQHQQAQHRVTEAMAKLAQQVMHEPKLRGGNVGIKKQDERAKNSRRICRGG